MTNPAIRLHRRKIPANVRAGVYRRARFRCAYCGLKFPATQKARLGLNAPLHRSGVWLELDHVVPYIHGGTDDFSNLRAACSRCNNSRGVDVDDRWGNERMVR